MKLFKIIMTSIRARCRPPKNMWPHDVMDEEDKIKAFTVACKILRGEKTVNKHLIQLSKWWWIYFMSTNPSMVSIFRPSLRSSNNEATQ